MQIAKRFDKVTLKKMGVSALLLIGGALLTYLSDNLLKLLGAVGIPPKYVPAVFGLCTWILNTVKEWLKGETQKVETP